MTLLTLRQQQIAAMLARGDKHLAIGIDLGISKQAVTDAAKTIRKKKDRCSEWYNRELIRLLNQGRGRGMK